MAHNFGLEAPICISKDSFEILRFSAFIWAQEKGHFMQKQVRKLCLKYINDSLFLLLSWHCHIFGYCHVSLHISDNLSPNLISSDITGKQRSRAFIWHQAWWDYRQYWWRYGLLKRGARFAGRTCILWWNFCHLKHYTSLGTWLRMYIGVVRCLDLRFLTSKVSIINVYFMH